MLDVRSRVGVVAAATGAAVFLALPVAAFGQVPNVGDVVGGVKDTVEDVAPPAPALPAPAPPVKLPAAAPAPKQQSSAPAPAPAAPAPAAPAPAPAGQQRSGSANSGAGGGGGGRGEQAASSSSSGSVRASAANEGGGKGSGRKERGEALGGKSANASQDDGGAPTDVEIASAADAPEEANPSTLPFTGFQLALIAALGLAAVGVGAALRRGARSVG